MSIQQEIKVIQSSNAKQNKQMKDGIVSESTVQVTGDIRSGAEGESV